MVELPRLVMICLLHSGKAPGSSPGVDTTSLYLQGHQLQPCLQLGVVALLGRGIKPCKMVRAAAREEAGTTAGLRWGMCPTGVHHAGHATNSTKDEFLRGVEFYKVDDGRFKSGRQGHLFSIAKADGNGCFKGLSRRHLGVSSTHAASATSSLTA